MVAATIDMPEIDTAALGALGDSEVWEIERVSPHPLNPRGALDPASDDIVAMVDSIRTDGLLSPLLVLPNGWIIAGHRRHLACQILGITHVRVIVRDISEESVLRLFLAENLKRQALDPLQEARAYNNLAQRLKLTVLLDIARVAQMPPTRVGSHLAILKLPEDLHSLFASAVIPVGAAPLLAELKSDDDMRAVATLSVGKTVRHIKTLVDVKSGKSPAKKRGGQHAAYRPRGLRRDAVVKGLENLGRASFDAPFLVEALDRVCCSCGMSDDPRTVESICGECPLMMFLNLLVGSPAA